MLRATVMLLSHIGRQDKADLLERALDICMFDREKNTPLPAEPDGCTCADFGGYVLDTVSSLQK
jgi:isocitrate dehydrogenase (NAD+)